MKHFITLLVCVLTLAIIPIKGEAQRCTLRGNTFEQVDSPKTSKQKDIGAKTPYTFKAKDGKEYPIYTSKQGKAFIWRVSKKTGKQYKQYLPEVTKELQKKKANI